MGNQLESSRERMLLRKIAENYYGVYLARVIQGIVHNLNGPLQILYIRSEQLEQSLEQLRSAIKLEAIAELEGLPGPMEERIKSIAKTLDALNVQLGNLTSDLIIERYSTAGVVKINKVIEDCIFLLNADMFFKHRINKVFNLDDALPVIKGRRTDFCIIILNLVQNALEAMVDAQDKHLVVETSTKEDKVIITVQDTGCGISEKDLEHIYETFFTTKKGSGHEAKLDEHIGLGLSLVSLLLEDYNGTIKCESIPGKTTFNIEIPCQVE